VDAKRHATHRGKVRAILGIARSFWACALSGRIELALSPIKEIARRRWCAIAFVPCAQHWGLRTIRKRTIAVGPNGTITRKGKEIAVQMMWS